SVPPEAFRVFRPPPAAHHRGMNTSPLQPRRACGNCASYTELPDADLARVVRFGRCRKLPSCYWRSARAGCRMRPERWTPRGGHDDNG
ncbi:MAG: hypothetical protein LBE06_11685, partial [Azoarcus sp.]|nr:hypothetical protein [Azoarcus sp.]